MDTAERSTIHQLAVAKYREVCCLPHGSDSGRRLELSGSDLTPEAIDEHVLTQYIDIGHRLGPHFLQSIPAVALEQFSIMAIARGEDTAGLLKSLLNSFMAAYLTPETSERAFAHLVDLEDLRAEVADSRGSKTSYEAPRTSTQTQH